MKNPVGYRRFSSIFQIYHIIIIYFQISSSFQIPIFFHNYHLFPNYHLFSRYIIIFIQISYIFIRSQWWLAQWMPIMACAADLALQWLRCNRRLAEDKTPVFHRNKLSAIIAYWYIYIYYIYVYVYIYVYIYCIYMYMHTHIVDFPLGIWLLRGLPQEKRGTTTWWLQVERPRNHKFTTWSELRERFPDSAILAGAGPWDTDVQWDTWLKWELGVVYSIIP